MTDTEQNQDFDDLAQWRSDIEKYLDELASASPKMRVHVKATRRRIDAYFAGMEGPARVVNAGIVNAGKSTLFNALADEAEELFPTADARKTTGRQEEAVGGLCFVDTPGLDALKADERRARLLFRESHIVLFVHSAIQGEFERSEMEFLEKLRELFADDEMRRQALIPVVTKAANAQDLEQITNKIRDQWKEVIGFAPPELFCVRAKTHLKGLRENKPALCTYSQIPKLREHLDGLVDDIAQESRKLTTRRVNDSLEKLEDRLNTLIERRGNKRAKTKQKVRARVDRMEEDILEFSKRHQKRFRQANR